MLILTGILLASLSLFKRQEPVQSTPAEPLAQ
jgi:hypothetical protein